MKNFIFNLNAKSTQKLDDFIEQNNFSDYREIFIQVFVKRNAENINSILELLKKKIQNAKIVGVETKDFTLSNNKVEEDTISLNFSIFEKSEIETFYFSTKNKSISFKSELIKKVNLNTKLFFIFATPNVRIETLLGILNGIAPNIPSVGTYSLKNIIFDDKIYQDGFSISILNGADLKLKINNISAFKQISKIFKVTDAKKVEIKTIENQKIDDFYKKFLNLDVLNNSKDVETLLNIPLLVKRGEVHLARKVSSIKKRVDEKNNVQISANFIGEFQKNDEVSFATTKRDSFFHFLQEHLEEIKEFNIEGIFVYGSYSRLHHFDESMIDILFQLIESEIQIIKNFSDSEIFYDEKIKKSVLNSFTHTFLMMSENSEEKNQFQFFEKIEKEILKRTKHDSINSTLNFASKKVLEELTSENRILEQYKNAVDEGVIVSKTDINGMITYANEQFSKISGYSYDELIGKSHNIVRDPSVPKSVYKIMWDRIKKEKKVWRGVIKNRRKDGQNYYVESMIKPILDSQNNILEYIALRRDMTKLIEKEIALKEEKRFTNSILNYQENIIFLTSEKNGLIEVNDRFFEYTEEQSLKEFRKKYKCVCEKFVVEEGLIYKFKDKSWTEYIYENSTQLHKAKILKPNGEGVFFSMKANKIALSQNRKEYHNIDDDFLYIVTLNDITKLEEAIREANSATVAKSRFLANMSHEIRTPMNGIMGFTELLKKTSLTSLQNKYIDIVSNSTQTLLGIVNDILDFSKIESGKMILDIVSFNPIKEIEPTLALFNAMSENKGITYLSFVDPKLPEWIKTDALRLKQVISNLIGNAIKFTSENGKVSVSVEKRESSIENHIKLFVSVKDTGIGIPEEKQKTIFDPFTQADESTTRKFGGTGLGLSISSHFVKLMGGKLQVTSESGKGSDFFFEIECESANSTSVETSWLEGNTTAILYQKQYSNDRSEAELLEQYLDSFGATTVSFDSTKDVQNQDFKLLWIFADTVELTDLEQLILKYSDIPIVLIAKSSNHQNIIDLNVHRLSMPFNSSNIYDILVNLLYEQEEMLNKTILTIDEDENTKNFSGNRVLVAEDNEVNQMFIKVILEEYNIQPKIANNGKEALEYTKKEDFDLIFMDINMPILGGIESTQAIREYHSSINHEHVPIIALTANAMDGDRESFMSQGMDDYLSKPVVISKLEEVLSKYLTTNKNSDDAIINNSDSEVAIQTEENLEDEHDFDFFESLEQENDDDFNEQKPESNNTEMPQANLIELPELNFDPISKDLIAQELGLPEMLIDKLIGTFVQTIDENIDDLKTAIKSQDSENIRTASHKIKGSAGNLRFKKLAELMKIIEESAKKGLNEGYDSLCNETQQEVTNIKNFAEN
jgi:PAS domain S-box-containing protein